MSIGLFSLLLHAWCCLTEDRTACEEYNATTSSELSGEEEEDVGRRKIKKKSFEDYYVEGKMKIES